MAEGDSNANDPVREELINEIKKNLVIDPMSVVGPSYHCMNKQLADLYFGINEELKGIYHLTEAHAATLRLQTVIRYDYKEDHLTNSSKDQKSKKLQIEHGLHKKYVAFDCELAKEEENGLMSRLREMPKEWTIVQLTKQAELDSRFRVIPKDKKVPRPTCLHISRLPCGSSLNEETLVSVMVDKPKGSEGMPSIFEIMDGAIKGLRTKHGRVSDIRKARELASQNIKEVVDELSRNYLREWRCLLQGALCRDQLRLQVKECIDQVFADIKFKSYKLESNDRQLLYCVASGAVHLTLEEIQSAVACVVTDPSLADKLVTSISEFQQNNSILLVARRHPVILIIDEDLDFLPWEMLPVLKRHPVSRISSIHFLHALYHEHKDHIVDGCRLVDKLGIGFYIVNPDDDLKEMETRLVSFLEKRMPNWSGLRGSNPSTEEFTKALTEKSVFLYCGHFNGTHFLKAEDISSMRVVALPLLFGCSSVALQNLGGRAQPTGASDKYLMASCACLIGMLWTVTSDDTDCITVMLLNSWLPGKPVDLKAFRRAGDMLSNKKEPELLRLLRDAREVALAYSNSAALIARGIPIKIRE